MQAYIVLKLTNEIVSVVHGKNERELLANALLEMSKHVPGIEDARHNFRLSKTPPQDASYRRARPDEFTMPNGKFQGQPLSAVPWRYLDRCLSQMCREKDPIMFQAIEDYLSTVDEYRDQRYHEEIYRQDENHRRDFTPSGALARA